MDWNDLGALRTLSIASLVIFTIAGAVTAIAGGLRVYADYRIGIVSAEQAKTRQRENQFRVESLQTGGPSFAYFMLYDFDLTSNSARDVTVIRKGEFPLYDVRLRVHDMDSDKDILNTGWGEINAPADFVQGKWVLPDNAYYRITFHARNGNWRQDLILMKSEKARCWLAATRVFDRKGSAVVYEHIDSEYFTEFGQPVWRQ